MSNQPTPMQTGLRYGLLLGLVNIIFAAVQYLAGLERNTAMTVVGVLLLMGAIYLAHKYFLQHGDGYMSFGQGVKIGVILSMISGAISAVFNYFYLQFVDDSVLTKALEEQQIKFEEQGMSDEQIDQAMGMAETFTTPAFTIVWILLFSLIFGLIISLIVSAITKKVHPDQVV